MNRSRENEAQLAFVFDMLVDVDEDSITEEEGQRVADELGIDIPKWARSIQRMLDLEDWPSLPSAIRISPVGKLGPFGIGDDDTGGPPPTMLSNFSFFCWTSRGTSKKGRPCWTTRYYVHHWNPIGGDA
jgi:hypothetical protein